MFKHKNDIKSFVLVRPNNASRVEEPHFSDLRKENIDMSVRTSRSTFRTHFCTFPSSKTLLNGKLAEPGT